MTAPVPQVPPKSPRFVYVDRSPRLLEAPPDPDSAASSRTALVTAEISTASSTSAPVAGEPTVRPAAVKPLKLPVATETPDTQASEPQTHGQGSAGKLSPRKLRWASGSQRAREQGSSPSPRALVREKTPAQTSASSSPRQRTSEDYEQAGALQAMLLLALSNPNGGAKAVREILRASDAQHPPPAEIFELLFSAIESPNQEQLESFRAYLDTVPAEALSEAGQFIRQNRTEAGPYIRQRKAPPLAYLAVFERAKAEATETARKREEKKD